MVCPLCSSKRSTTTDELPNVVSLRKCSKCGAIYGQSYLGDFHSVVHPFFDTEQVDPSSTRYYDVMTLGSDGLTRHHGWFNPATKRITQVG